MGTVPVCRHRPGGVAGVVDAGFHRQLRFHQRDDQSFLAVPLGGLPAKSCLPDSAKANSGCGQRPMSVGTRVSTPSTGVAPPVRPSGRVCPGQLQQVERGSARVSGFLSGVTRESVRRVARVAASAGVSVPLAIVIAAGQRGAPQFELLLEAIRVPGTGWERPRKRPHRVRADKGVRLPGQPGLPAQAGNQSHDPGACGPGPQPAEARLPRRSATRIRQDRLQAAARGRMRHQPARAPPHGRYEIGKTRRPLRGDRAGRSPQRVAVTSAVLLAREGQRWLTTLTTRPLGSRTKNRRTPHSSSRRG